MSAEDTRAFEKFKLELKQFFKSSRISSGNIDEKDEITANQDVEKLCCKNLLVEEQIKLMEEIDDIMLSNMLEENVLEKLCHTVEDILDHPSTEYRHAILSFFRRIAEDHFEKLGLMRYYFFKIIKKHEDDTDFGPRLDLLKALTDNGKDLLYFENEIGSCLLKWTRISITCNRTHDFLNMLVNIVKYNSAYISEDLITNLIQCISFICCHSDSEEVVLDSLLVLDSIICYCKISTVTLPIFIVALCKTMNLQLYSSASWKIMKNLLGTHMGHFALCIMCSMMSDENPVRDISLIRGIIFAISMALWSDKSVFNLKYTPSFILPYFIQITHYDNITIMYEVVLSLGALIDKYGDELSEQNWDRIFDIVEYVTNYCENNNINDGSACISAIHEIITAIEKLMDLNQYNGNMERTIQLIEFYLKSRSDLSVFRLMDHLLYFFEISSDWKSKLNLLLTQYFEKEERESIQIEALRRFFIIFKQHVMMYEKDLIEFIVKYLSNISQQENVSVQNYALQMLMELYVDCRAEHAVVFIDIAENTLNKQFESKDVTKPASDEICYQFKIVVNGLINAFLFQLNKPPASNCVRILFLLIDILENHYRHPQLLDHNNDIRITILEFLLKFRMDSQYRLGHAGDPALGPVFSPYLIVDQRRSSCSSSCTSIPQSPLHKLCFNLTPLATLEASSPPVINNETIYVSLSNACGVIVNAIKQEIDWHVLKFVLELIPEALHNRALVACRHSGGEVEQLVTVLCNIINDKSSTLPDLLKNTPTKFTYSELHTHIVPVLTAFSSCHVHLEPSLQQKLIKSFEVGLVGPSASQCITALTVCILEMHDTMVKLLPEVLLNLSKISATVPIAIPILEFLSMLTTFPTVFASFVSEQYRSVFAIILPYTNPFKYNQYIVSLAHHIISVWFLRCRRTLRKDFVKYIIKGLKSNALDPFMEGYATKMKNLKNEDSSNRKRSASLNERGSAGSVSSRRKERSIGGSYRFGANYHANDVTGSAGLEKSILYQSLMLFQRELTETCIDLMSRYTFSTFSPLPRRHPSCEFILRNGQSSTWLLGAKLLTVTTSGCTQQPARKQDNLCRYCSVTCTFNLSNIVRAISDAQHSLPPSHISEKSCNERLTATVAQQRSSCQKIEGGGEPPSTSPSQSSADGYSTGELGGDNRTCSCWCQGWAEIKVRRPTGDMSWMICMQDKPNAVASYFSLSSLIENVVVVPNFTELINAISDTSKDDLFSNNCDNADVTGSHFSNADITTSGNNNNSCSRGKLDIYNISGLSDDYADVDQLITDESCATMEQMKYSKRNDESHDGSDKHFFDHQLFLTENTGSIVSSTLFDDDEHIISSSAPAYVSNSYLSNYRESSDLEVNEKSNQRNNSYSCGIASEDISQKISLSPFKTVFASGKYTYNDNNMSMVDEAPFLQITEDDIKVYIPVTDNDSNSTPQKETTDVVSPAVVKNIFHDPVNDCYNDQLDNAKHYINHESSVSSALQKVPDRFNFPAKKDINLSLQHIEAEKTNDNKRNSRAIESDENATAEIFNKYHEMDCEQKIGSDENCITEVANTSESRIIASGSLTKNDSANSENDVLTINRFNHRLDQVLNPTEMDNLDSSPLRTPISPFCTRSMPNSPISMLMFSSFNSFYDTESTINDNLISGYGVNFELNDFNDLSRIVHDQDTEFNNAVINKTCLSSDGDDLMVGNRDKHSDTEQQHNKVLLLHEGSTADSLCEPLYQQPSLSSRLVCTSSLYMTDAEESCLSSSFPIYSSGSQVIEIDVENISQFNSSSSSSDKACERQSDLEIVDVDVLINPSTHSTFPSSKSEFNTKWELPAVEEKAKGNFSSPQHKENIKSGMNPSYIFLQLYHTPQLGLSQDKPLLVPSTSALERALNVFDMIPPYETHKVGVLYVGPGQANSEINILQNEVGSVRYIYFLQKLGKLLKLTDADSQNVFLGGLERGGKDGKFAYIWKDDVLQVIFHVATLMPTFENDSRCSNKKRHIGNDYVTIVYNESNEDYDLNTVTGQYNFACIVIKPLDHKSNQVVVKVKGELLGYIGNIKTKIVSDENVSLLARQLALHLNLAARVYRSLGKESSGGSYASNWLERLRKINHIRGKIIEHMDSMAKISKLPSTGNIANNNNPNNGRINVTFTTTTYTATTNTVSIVAHASVHRNTSVENNNNNNNNNSSNNTNKSTAGNNDNQSDIDSRDNSNHSVVINVDTNTAITPANNTITSTIVSVENPSACAATIAAASTAATTTGISNINDEFYKTISNTDNSNSSGNNGGAGDIGNSNNDNNKSDSNDNDKNNNDNDRNNYSNTNSNESDNNNENVSISSGINHEGGNIGNNIINNNNDGDGRDYSFGDNTNDNDGIKHNSANECRTSPINVKDNSEEQDSIHTLRKLHNCDFIEYV